MNDSKSREAFPIGAKAEPVDPRFIKHQLDELTDVTNCLLRTLERTAEGLIFNQPSEGMIAGIDYAITQWLEYSRKFLTSNSGQQAWQAAIAQTQDGDFLTEGLDRVIHPVREHGNNATIPCTAGVTSSASDPTPTRAEVVVADAVRSLSELAIELFGNGHMAASRRVQYQANTMRDTLLANGLLVGLGE